MQFATNHIGDFALATGLRRLVGRRRRVPTWPALSSIGRLFGPVVFDDLHYRFRPYDQWTSYGQSKSAIVLFAVAAAQRWADDGIVVNALMPGNIASTALVRHLAPDDLADLGKETPSRCPPASVEQGAATSVLLAARPEVEAVTALLRGLRRGAAGVRNARATPAASPRTRSTRRCRPALADLQRANPMTITVTPLGTV